MTTTSDPRDGLLQIRNGYVTSRWNFSAAIGTSLTAPGGIGNPVTVNYSFLSAFPDYYQNSLSSFAAFTETQKQAARTVLTSISNFAEIKFLESDLDGEISFALSAQDKNQSGFAYPPSFSYFYLGDSKMITAVTIIPQSGDVWLNNNIAWSDDDFLQKNGNGYGALVHEIGHALGLKHPFEGDFQLSSELDNQAYTAMSYNYHPYGLWRTVTETSAGNYLFQYSYIEPETFMPLDIAAIQYLYGANTNYNRTNNIYTFSPNQPFIKTIWDGGGIDTISIANFTRGSTIKLQAGAFSSINIPSDPLPPGFIEPSSGIYNGTNNLAIAYDTIIENAIGGAGNDRLIGNQVANNLQGGAGNDTLKGNGGNDTLNGGNGIDQLTGDAGRDIFILTYRGGSDKISDFTPPEDTIQLDNFPGLNHGTLPSNQLRLASTARDADDFLIYDAATGNLFYDSDGNGSSAAIKIAQIGTHLALSAADFEII